MDSQEIFEDFQFQINNLAFELEEKIRKKLIADFQFQINNIAFELEQYIRRK